MSRSLVVLRFALGELLAGRRLPIVAALVALPLWLPSLLAPSSGQDPTSFGLDLFRNLVVPVLLPVVSFAFSTAALGNELRRGTITNLLLKPIPRWSVLGAEYLAAVLATLGVLLPAEVVGHLLVARGLGSAVLLEGMLAATVVGVLAYSAIGLLLSLVLSRALLGGLAYALLWEGAVAVAAAASPAWTCRNGAAGERPGRASHRRGRDGGFVHGGEQVGAEGVDGGDDRQEGQAGHGGDQREADAVAEPALHHQAERVTAADAEHGQADNAGAQHPGRPPAAPPPAGVASRPGRPAARRSGRRRPRRCPGR